VERAPVTQPGCLRLRLYEAVADACLGCQAQELGLVHDHHKNYDAVYQKMKKGVRITDWWEATGHNDNDQYNRNHMAMSLIAELSPGNAYP